MAIREVIQIGHPSLKAENREVVDFKSEKVKQIVQDLVDTMRESGLVGMAAPQIAENYRIFVTEPRVTPTRTIDQADKLRVYINPVIKNFSDEEVIIYEGCGSVLKGSLFGPVKRPRQITIEAFDENGENFQLTCDGLLARVIQHEYDHLQGIEFTEKVDDYKKLMAVEFYIANIKTSSEQIENSKVNIKEFKKI
jgi:peptide deformylase